MAKQLVTNFITQKVENFQLTEKCSATAVKTLLLSQKILNEDEKNVLRGYQKITKITGSGKFRVATIEYSDNIGRLNASIVGEANPGMVQMYLNNSIKCNILNGVYSDLDIVSCHPTIILQLCEIYSLPTTNIKKLLFSTELNLSKIDKLTIMYGGSLKRKDTIDIEKEIHDNATSLLLSFPEFLVHARTNTKKNYNVVGSAFSFLIQTIEKQIAMKMIKYIQNETTCIVGAYIYDGLHIEGDATEIIDMVQKHINTTTPFNIKLKIKPFQASAFLHEPIVVQHDYEAAQVILNGITKNSLVRCDGRLYYKIEKCFTSNDLIIDPALLKHVMSQDLFLEKN